MAGERWSSASEQHLIQPTKGTPRIVVGITGLTLAALAVAIASLILSIIILQKVNSNGNSSATNELPASILSTVPVPAQTSTIPASQTTDPTRQCQAPGKVSTKPEFKAAADQLLRAIDPSVDPCTDMYQFACGTYDKAGGSGTFSEAQLQLNLEIAAHLDALDDSTASLTERISKAAYLSCVDAFVNNSISDADKYRLVQADLNNIFGFPLFNDGPSPTEMTMESLFTKLGQMERQFFQNALLSGSVSVDYDDIHRNALYLDPPSLPSPSEYYTLPQFIADLDDERDFIVYILSLYQSYLGLRPDLTMDDLQAFAEQVVDFERKIAMSSWPDAEIRNFKLQNTAYNIDDLLIKFPALRLREYVSALVDGVAPAMDFKVFISEPTYFFWLNTLLENGEVTIEQLVNYAAVQYLYDNADYLPLGEDGMFRARSLGWMATAERRKSGRRKSVSARKRALPGRFDNEGEKFMCIMLQIIYIPYAPGYTYVKNRDDKWDVRRDIMQQTEAIIDAFSEQIDSLPWMLQTSKDSAHGKSASLIRNYLWPEYMYGNFKDTTKLDEYHQDYVGILTASNYWEVTKVFKYGLGTREFYRMLGEQANRYNFFQSPAMVNAWYQQERNSITFPLANLNPPYYHLGWPQAFNYAGQGGTVGHELTHGYDDEGIQFGPEGGLVNCTYTNCGILDGVSRRGFVDMAQCVVTQFNSQCCPVADGNVRCVDGSKTQGENIADLGGLLAAYRAYRKFVEQNGAEEDLLPGLEQYTPNQIFWISYAYVWCAATSKDSLIDQLLHDTHAPHTCRVNQVMQDIPEFGQDFGCKRGSPMFPEDEDRCRVWTGY